MCHQSWITIYGGISCYYTMSHYFINPHCLLGIYYTYKKYQLKPSILTILTHKHILAQCPKETIHQNIVIYPHTYLFQIDFQNYTSIYNTQKYTNIYIRFSIFIQIMLL